MPKLIAIASNYMKIVFEKYQNWLVVLIGSFIGCIYIFRVDQVIGQFVDDAWYLVLAKSIVEKGSYQLISSPIQGIQPIYPPGFSLILAVVMKVVPASVAHLWTLKYISMIAMIGVGYLSFKYYVRILKLPGYISLFSAALVILSPAFVFIATSTLMSECVFTFFLLFTIVKLETQVEKNDLNNRVLIEIGLLVAFAFQLRSAAAVLILAILVRLILIKQYYSVLKVVSIICLVSTPWLLYSKVSYSNNLQKPLQGGAIVINYLEQLQMKTAGAAGSGTAKVEDYAWRVKENIKSILERDMVGMFLPALLRDSGSSGTEVIGLGGGMRISFAEVPFVEGAKYFSLFFSLLVISGILIQCRQQITSVEISLALTLLMTIIWPWLTFRFILPFFPFLIGYLVCSLRKLPQLIERSLSIRIGENTFVRSTLLCFLFFIFTEHINYVLIKQRTPQLIGWIQNFNSILGIADDIKSRLPAQAVIASTNPAQLFLLTGHVGVALDLNEQAWNHWRQAGLRYIVNTKPTLPLSGRNGDTVTVIYQSPQMPNLQVVDLGEPEVLTRSNQLHK